MAGFAQDEGLDKIFEIAPSGLHPTLPAPASELAGDPVRKGAKDGAPEHL